MADYCVGWGKDVDPYVRRLASEYIKELSERCDRIARKIMRARRRSARVAVITAHVNHDMLNGTAHSSFRKLGFHFVLREKPDQPANVRKREFELNFATKPKFAPEDMPLRLRKRKGKAVTARPAKAKKKRRVAVRLAARRARGIMNRILRSLLTSRRGAVTAITSLTHCASNLPSVITNVSHRVSFHVRTLKLLLYKAWRRRPRVAFSTREIWTSFIKLSEPLDYTPTRAWLEPRNIGSSLGLSLWVNVLASSEPPIDWDSFPFGEPPPESEQLAS
jgi:hypothetical protein